MNKNILIVAILIVATLSMGELYRTTVDTDYGFYRVRPMDDPMLNVSYMNKTLIINSGDTVEWLSMTDPDERVTIINNENLWNNTQGILRYSYATYRYTFNSEGIYTFYIKEYPRLKQKIVVRNNAISDPIIEVSSMSTTPVAIVATPESTSELTTIIENKITPNITVSTLSNETKPKNIPGFELILGIFGLIFLSRKI